MNEFQSRGPSPAEVQAGVVEQIKAELEQEKNPARREKLIKNLAELEQDNS